MENSSNKSSDSTTDSATDTKSHIPSRYEIMREAMTIARTEFALDSLKKYVLKNPKNNVFFSPHLIYQNLFMILLGIEGNTEKSLRRVLYISETICKNELYLMYINGGVNDFTYVTEKKSLSTCRIFSRLWISNCKLNKDGFIIHKLQKDFWSGHQLTTINFNSHPDRKRIFINNCIKSVTENRICDLLPSDSIHSKTDLVLINAIYYKTQQMEDPSKYNKKNDGNSKNQNLLEQNDKSDAKSLIIFEEVTDSTNGISMYFISLKDDSKIEESDKIIQCIEYLITAEGFQKEQLNNKLKCCWKQEANVSFPTFKFVQDLRMYELLEILGVPELTPLGTACLAPFFSQEDLRLGDTVHRVNIETTPNHIVAAASNAFFTVNSSQHEHIDTGGSYEPCICLIYDKIKRNILFCGALLKEKKETATETDISVSCNDGNKA